MKNLFILLLSTVFIVQIAAKDFSKSDKKKLDKAFSGAELAAKGKTSKDFKKGYKTVKSALKSLKRKYANHPQVIELGKKFTELEKLVPDENSRADLEKNLKKMQISLKKVSNGVASAKKRLQKDANTVQMKMVALKMTKNNRFSQNITVAEAALKQAKENGIELRSEDEIVEEIKLQQAMLGLTRSQLKTIAKIEKAIKKAEQKDQFSQIKKEMENAQKLLEPIAEVLAENLKVVSLQKRCENLEGKLAKSKVAFDLRDDLKMLESNLKAADGAKDFNKMERAMSSARSIVAKISRQDLSDNEEIEKQVNKLRERTENFEEKYKSLQVVAETKDDLKKLSYRIPFSEESYDYRKIKKAMEDAKPVLGKLNNKENLSDNKEIFAKVKDYSERFEKLEEKIVFCKKAYDLDEQTDSLDREMRDLFYSALKGNEAKELPITASTDKYQIMGNAKTLSKAITVIPESRKKYQSKIDSVKAEVEILSKRNADAFSKTIENSEGLLSKWQNALESEKPLHNHSLQQAKQLYNELDKGINAIYTKINSFAKYPKEHHQEFETFQNEISTNVWNYMTNFKGQKDFETLVKNTNKYHEDGKKYLELVRTTRYMHSDLERGGNLGTAKHRLSEIRNTKHKESLKIIAFYDKYLTRWDSAASDLKKIRSQMLTNLAKSSSQLHKDFEKHSSKYTIVAANRVSILKDLNANVGKAIKDLTREKLTYSSAWRLNHGNDLFYYALKNTIVERIDAFYEDLKAQFNKYKQQVAKKYDVEQDGLPYWSFPHYLSMNMLPVIETSVTYTPKVAVRDQWGSVKAWIDGTPIQIVKVRVVGFKSKYFTIWENSPQQKVEMTGLYK
ncbi:hypothetical protein [Candidatus Uabimicrobium sp. HlEnr_7]|uniref:hypothetical protein n=1 Tax=Candidatus Uabimicrobium helgolandensis TaxID=3095367 RepID=UPI00355922E5